MQTWFARKTCRLCNSQVVPLVELKPTPLANAYVSAPCEQEVYPLGLTQCVECDHVQLGVVVDPEVLYADYRYKTGVSSSFRKHLKSLAEEISPKGFVLEIGSNDGTLLDYFAELGNRVLGVDPASTCTKHPNIAKPFNYEFARQFKPFNPPADLIVALNVLAHIDNLGGVFDGVEKFLSDAGLFVFEVQYLKDLVDGFHWDMIYHEHLDYHHIRPLVKSLAKHGLYVHDVKHVDTQGGSIRVYARKTPGNYVCPDEEIDLSGFVQKLHELKNPLEGVTGSIAGYGAPAKATTFMYQTGARVDYIVDDTPDKQGMFTPGLNIPIVSSDELKLRKPDKVFPLAWNFAAELRAKHPELNWL